jgi:hypothetical protein
VSDAILTWADHGGMVLAVLVVMGIATVFLLLERWWVLSVLQHREPLLPVTRWYWVEPDELPSELDTLARWTTTLVLLAPLVGLLGTVSGMVETFNALAGDAQAGMSMAGGISRALITTQYGLLIAIPGTLASRALDRKAMRIRDLWRTRAQEPLVVSR